MFEPSRCVSLSPWNRGLHRPINWAFYWGKALCYRTWAYYIQSRWSSLGVLNSVIGVAFYLTFMSTHLQDLYDMNIFDDWQEKEVASHVASGIGFGLDMHFMVTSTITAKFAVKFWAHTPFKVSARLFSHNYLMYVLSFLLNLYLIHHSSDHTDGSV